MMLDLDAIVEQEVAAFRAEPDFERALPLGAAWLRLLAEDRPLTVPEFAAVLGWPEEDIAGALTEHGVTAGDFGMAVSGGGDEVTVHDEGAAALPGYRIRWLDTGEVGGLPGCSDDALWAVFMAGRPARVELPCPSTGRVVHVDLDAAGHARDVDPPGAVAVMRRPDVDWSPRAWTRADCGDGLLFASEEVAAGWLSAHPKATAVPVDFFVRVSRRKFEALVAPTLRAGSRPPCSRA
jgi:hypothetical protein